MSTLILPYPSTHPDLCHGKYVAGLFANGEQGAWYDPSDLSTLFQDAYGTTPVTAVGQPVGLILDKSKRVIFKITKADLLDKAKWTGYNSVYGSTPTAVQLADGTVRITRNSTDTYVGFAPRANAYSLPPGCVVHFKYSVKSNTNNATSFSGEPYDKWRDVNPGWFGAIPNTSALTRNTVAINYTAAPITTNSSGWAQNLFGFYMIGAGHAADEYIDVFDFEITAYAPAARQRTAASRPTLQQDSSGKYYLSFDGVDDYLSTGSIDFTATDKVTVLAGVNRTVGSGGLYQTICAQNYQNNYSWYHLIKVDQPSELNIENGRRGSGSHAFTNSPDDFTGLYDKSLVSTYQFDLSNTPELVSQRVNGLSKVAGTGIDSGAGPLANAPLYIGAINASQHRFSGRLHGLIVRGAATDDLHLTHAEKYLAYKSGVSL